VELYPRIEAKWMKKGYQEKISTPGYNKRTNIFITLFWPKKLGYIWNKFERRRSREFKLHLSNLIQHAKRHSIKRILLFIDHAPCHKTKTVKRLIRRYKIIKTKLLPKKAPELNPAEWVINRPLKSTVCTNRSYTSIHDVNHHTTDFLRKHRMTLRT
jgi:hypothetical protein